MEAIQVLLLSLNSKDGVNFNWGFKQFYFESKSQISTFYNELFGITNSELQLAEYLTSELNSTRESLKLEHSTEQ